MLNRIWQLWTHRFWANFWSVLMIISLSLKCETMHQWWTHGIHGILLLLLRWWGHRCRPQQHPMEWRSLGDVGVGPFATWRQWEMPLILEKHEKNGSFWFWRWKLSAALLPESSPFMFFSCQISLIIVPRLGGLGVIHQLIFESKGQCRLNAKHFPCDKKILRIPGQNESLGKLGRQCSRTLQEILTWKCHTWRSYNTSLFLWIDIYIYIYIHIHICIHIWCTVFRIQKNHGRKASAS